MRLIIGFIFVIVAAQAANAECARPAGAQGMMHEAKLNMNAARMAAGRAPLARAPLLDAAAEAHACDMVRRGVFSHRGAKGEGPASRIKAQGYCTRLSAENIAQGQVSGREVMADWMASPGHRRNILNRKVREYGLAVADMAGGPVWVLVLARPCR